MLPWQASRNPDRLRSGAASNRFPVRLRLRWRRMEGEGREPPCSRRTGPTRTRRWRRRTGRRSGAPRRVEKKRFMWEIKKLHHSQTLLSFIRVRFCDLCLYTSSQSNIDPQHCISLPRCLTYSRGSVKGNVTCVTWIQMRRLLIWKWEPDINNKKP